MWVDVIARVDRWEAEVNVQGEADEVLIVMPRFNQWHRQEGLPRCHVAYWRERR